MLLERMGLSPADLVATPASRPAVPTFAGYVPVVSATASPGTRQAYGSYWNRVVLPAGHRLKFDQAALDAFNEDVQIG